MNRSKIPTIGIILIILMVLLNIMPPLFSEGQIFDVHIIGLNDCKEPTVLTGVYFDNVYFIIKYILVGILGLVLPILIPTLPYFWKEVSRICAGWFMAGLLYEIYNLSIPVEVLNTANQGALYTKFLLTFAFFISFTAYKHIYHGQGNRRA